MSVNLGEISTGQMVAVVNPADPTQVWNYTTGAWVAKGTGPFTQCVVAGTVTSGITYAELASLPDLAVSYTILIYESGATAFTDDHSTAVFDPQLATEGNATANKDEVIAAFGTVEGAPDITVEMNEVQGS